MDDSYLKERVNPTYPEPILAILDFPSPGEKLRQLLLEHGTFDKIEGQLERWHQQLQQKKQTGGAVTRERLMAERHFTKHLDSVGFCACVSSLTLPNCHALYKDPIMPPAHSQGRWQTTPSRSGRDPGGLFSRTLFMDKRKLTSR